MLQKLWAKLGNFWEKLQAVPKMVETLPLSPPPKKIGLPLKKHIDLSEMTPLPFSILLFVIVNVITKSVGSCKMCTDYENVRNDCQYSKCLESMFAIMPVGSDQ